MVSVFQALSDSSVLLLEQACRDIENKNERIVYCVSLHLVKGKGIRFIVLYPPKCSHDLPPLVGLYTRKPFQSPRGYSRAAGSIEHTSSKHCLIYARWIEIIWNKLSCIRTDLSAPVGYWTSDLLITLLFQKEFNWLYGPWKLSNDSKALLNIIGGKGAISNINYYYY